MCENAKDWSEAPGPKQRLVAILAADAAGYSRLMTADDRATLIALDAARVIFRFHIEANNGRVIDMAGDSVLAVFKTAIGAVTAALAIQEQLAESSRDVARENQMQFRIGVHLGDVIQKDDGTVYGDGVNVAARLEGLAKPGGVMVSDIVHGTVRGRLAGAFEDAGEFKVKNIERTVRAFRAGNIADHAGTRASLQQTLSTQLNKRWLAAALGVLGIAAIVTLSLNRQLPGVEPADPAKMALGLPTEPSVAVLPFDDLSAKQDQEYFADGVTQDIITDLSKVPGLFVVARNSTFAYKGKRVKIRQVAEELGVRYVLEGSVRRSEARIRVTAQLIDALQGNHLWAERYDRELQDVFAIQSEVAQKVSKALAVTVKAGDIERLFLKQTTSIEAYDIFLQARRIVDAVGKDNAEHAELLFNKVIHLDPDFASAYAGLSFNYSVKARFHFTDTPEADAKRSLDFARKAIGLDSGLAWAHIALGGAYLANGNPDLAVDAVRRAVIIQPNGYEANLFMGLYLQFSGQAGKAVEHLEIAQRLNPVDTVRKLAFLGFAYFMNGDYEKAADVFTKRLKKFPVENELNYVFLAAAYARLGRMEDAARNANLVVKLNPRFGLAKWRWIDAYKLPRDRQHLYDAAKLAGVPE